MSRQFILILALFSQIAFAQTKLVFHPCFGKSALLGNKFSLPNASESITFEIFRFYVSGIQLRKNGKSVWEEKNSFHLVDASDEKSLSLHLKIPKGVQYDTIRFNLGIDSATNVSGALGGDLDPTKGMYWTWQSGYINLKLEGKSSLCTTRNNEFQFHLGGYTSPFASIQNINLPAKPAATIDVWVDVLQFIQAINLRTKNQVMSPGPDAVVLSVKAVNMFSVNKP